MNHDDEDTERDDEDTPHAEDHYPRTNEPRSAPAAVKQLTELLGLEGVDFTQHDEAWWAERDRQLAELKARDVVAAERERMRKRASDLEHGGGFPKLLIEAAMNVPIETPAMGFARRFPYLPSKIIVFAGGVGAGKSTAAVWLAMKGEDRDPGFIRASELERRGRYDKHLDAWLKERTSLVIDDLGVEVLDSKRVFASLLDEIVDAFYSRRRALIMTTNLLPRVTDEMREEARRLNIEPEPQFVERYGERVRSRVRQIGEWADCGTLDLRRPTVPQA